MKTKLFLTTLALVSLLSLAFVVNGFLQHALDNGRLVYAQSFPNGDALTVSRTNGGLQVGYYAVDGGKLLSQPLLLSGSPESMIIQACGGRIQIFISYYASSVDDLSTALAERFVVALPVAQSCVTSSYLPIILNMEIP